MLSFDRLLHPSDVDAVSDFDRLLHPSDVDALSELESKHELRGTAHVLALPRACLPLLQTERDRCSRLACDHIS